MIKLTKLGSQKQTNGDTVYEQNWSKQNPHPNGSVAAVYEDPRVMQDPLDTPLIGLN